MALFSKKEFEILQAKNEVLESRIAVLEFNISLNDKLLSEREAKIRELENKIELLNIEIKEHENRQDFSSHHVKKFHEDYDKEIDKLEKEISTLKTRPHNERGAGRKHRATPEQREYIISLSAQGVSQNKIAGIMMNQTGAKWNKTTIRNIIISAKN